MKARNWLLLLVLSGVTVCAFVAAHVHYFLPRGFTFTQISWSEVTKPIILTVFTLGGIFFRTVYNTLRRETAERVVIKDSVRRAIDGKDFWMAAVVSPIVILSLYPSLGAVDSNALLALMAYENGFFFKVIFENKERSKEDEEYG